MRKPIARVATISIATAVAALSVAGLAACSSTPAPEPTSSPTPTVIVDPVVAPVMVPVDSSLNGKTIDVPANTEMVLSVPAGTETQWNAMIPGTDVAAFMTGGTDGTATFNPSIRPLNTGKSEVTLSNATSGETYTFTINVTK